MDFQDSHEFFLQVAVSLSSFLFLICVALRLPGNRRAKYETSLLSNSQTVAGNNSTYGEVSTVFYFSFKISFGWSHTWELNAWFILSDRSHLNEISFVLFCVDASEQYLKNLIKMTTWNSVSTVRMLLKIFIAFHSLPRGPIKEIFF